MRAVLSLLATVLAGALVACRPPDRRAEDTAVPTAEHPLAGFWKSGGCADQFGLAIAPAGGLYSVSFCGPGGCFAPGTYRPNTSIVNDSNYRVLDNNTIEVAGRGGFTKYVRCPSRVNRRG
jgi:hypothetical protein